MVIGLMLLVLSDSFVWAYFEKGHLEAILLVSTFAWIIAVFFTDKYVHKYPPTLFFVHSGIAFKSGCYHDVYHIYRK